MLKLKHSFLIAALLLLVVSAHADNRSVWQKIVDFFSPMPAVTCDGPECDAIRELDKKIGKVEGKYSRERRPVHKARIKKELDSLQVVRDSLWAVIEAKPLTDSVKVDSVKTDSAKIDSAKAETVAPVNAETAEPAKTETANAVTAAETATPAAEVAKPETCAHDTVYVRDTVTVHDTVYVIVTNKPAEAPAPAAPETAPAPASTETTK